MFAEPQHGQQLFLACATINFHECRNAVQQLPCVPADFHDYAMNADNCAGGFQLVVNNDIQRLEPENMFPHPVPMGITPRCGWDRQPKPTRYRPVYMAILSCKAKFQLRGEIRSVSRLPL